MKRKIFILLITTIISVTATFAEQLFKSNAVASFYAEKFHGRRTSSGEIFNMNDLTAAHKTLPFGTKVKVTNLENGKSVVVRINDRGPFVAGREIDLSKAAATQIDMIKQGTANVSLSIIAAPNGSVIPKETTTKQVTTSKPKPESSTTAPSAKSTTEKVTETIATPIDEEENVITAFSLVVNKKWDIQLGSFTVDANAKSFAQQVLKAGFTNVVYQRTNSVTRVAIANIATNDVQAILDALEEKGFTDYFVKERKE